MPICPVCETNKRKSDFSLRPNGKVVSRCKKCQREYSRDHYKKNKEKHNAGRYARRKEWGKQIRKIIDKLKDVPCTDCGDKHPSWAMDFDHLRDKEFSLGGAVRLGYSEERILREVAKCEVVCCLCHRYRTYGSKRSVG